MNIEKANEIPESWINVKHCIDEKAIKLKIPHGHYSKTDFVVEAMREVIPDEYKSLYHLRNTRNGTVSILTKGNADLEFPKSSKGLGEMLGFRNLFISEGNTSKYEVDLRGGVYGLYIYSDIVQPHIVGDTFAPLLRVIPVDSENRYHAIYVKTYANPDLYELSQTNFESIEIDIRSDTGHRLQFTHGKTLVKLMFKKV